MTPAALAAAAAQASQTSIEVVAVQQTLAEHEADEQEEKMKMLELSAEANNTELYHQRVDTGANVHREWKFEMKGGGSSGHAVADDEA